MKKVLSVKPKPLGLLGIGVMVVFVGAVAKITKTDFASTVLLFGLIIEIIGVIYFIKYLKKNKLKS
jgi:hypothetical protein|tara:strand:- start:29 stop:226 length:198 start_codon:yes stop_codon:yes gene_type:complete